MVNPPHSLKTPRFLVTGANGQLGFELQRALAPLGEVVACGRDACDLSNPDSIRAAIRAAKPDMIFSAGAYTAVDKAESEPDLARAVNATAPGILGEEAAKLGALVFHYSTDYVFDGTKPSAYREEDATNPLGVYGKTKLVGEKALAASGAAHLIFRTSWVFGAHGKNFIKTILRLASSRDELRIVADQFGAPTGAALLADASAHIAARYRRDGRENFPFGLYHLAASGETSWHSFARHIVAKAAAANSPLQATIDRILPIPAAEYPTPAARPANSRLDTSKFRTVFGLHLPDWKHGVDQVLDVLLEK
ncbi:MAG: dTDP-4-dehydrorhamnose reductase [Spartobacteria bacterium AMD-G4]|nr:MAG: dTDP-4-dehydrorhamnose reductase [Spartobacteria bacterium AMD-G4]